MEQNIFLQEYLEITYSGTSKCKHNALDEEWFKFDMNVPWHVQFWVLPGDKGKNS